MPAMVQGQLVWALIPDPAGPNPKYRPAVILDRSEEIQPNQPVTAVAISSRIDQPLPSHHVLLPWHRSGHPRTGLRKPCVAVCDWQVVIQLDDIQEIGGIVPAKVIVEIVERIRQLRGNG